MIVVCVCISIEYGEFFEKSQINYFSEFFSVNKNSTLLGIGL